jgi:hypothetical protein
MRRLLFIALVIAMCWFAHYAAHAAEVSAPTKITAGEGTELKTSGAGSATFYLIGPAGALSREIELGQPVRLAPEEVRAAGRYIAVVRSGGTTSSSVFYVTAAKPAKLNFLARPSRVPASRPGAISGAAFVFDEFNNLVLAPVTVKFDLAVAGGPAASRSIPAERGIAWTRMDSGRREGAAQFVASVGDAQVRRVVQQTAAEPCNLRMRTAQRTEKSIIVETDPVRDCSGNAVPDGTIVTFTLVDPKGRSTVDARIRKGIARAELPRSEKGVIYVASGVVVGNELRVGGGQ